MHVDCAGVDHIDFAADGAYLIATCEFSGRLVRVDLHTLKVVGYLNLPGSSPQDTRQPDLTLGPRGVPFRAGTARKRTRFLSPSPIPMRFMRLPK